VHIAFVAWRDLANARAGGSEHVVDRLALAAIEAGHDVTLFCGGPVGPNRYRTVDLGGPITQYLVAPWRVRRHGRRIDLVVDVENGVPFMSPLWWRGPVLLLVHHVHRDQWRQHFGRAVTVVGRALEEHVMPRVYRRRRVYAVSRSTQRELVRIGFDGDVIAVIESGIDRPVAVGPKAQEPTFLALGRAVAHKRLDLLVEMWAKVHAEIGGRLLVVGDGPELPTVRGAIERTGAQAIELLGFVDDASKAALLDEAWLLVHAASHEGWGIGVIEAAAHATPCVAFDVPGVRDAVDDGTTGVLTHDADGFVEAWVALARDDMRRAAMGTAARRRAETMGWERTGRAFVDLALATVVEHARDRDRQRERRRRRHRR
jgi:glycosyltransferase involved in cell wall biosynthesis